MKMHPTDVRITESVIPEVMHNITTLLESEDQLNCPEFAEVSYLNYLPKLMLQIL